jgi:hypothetical protein
MRQVKLLKEIYKTFQGARKRCAFEDAMAKSEFERGDKARLYIHTIAKGDDETWRVTRNVD